MYMLGPGLGKLTVMLAAAMLSACALSGAARAADAVQVDWEPNRYRMICESPDACQMGEPDHRAMERNLELAVSDLKATKFRPSRWRTRAPRCRPAGGAMPIEAMTRIGECMSVCQNA